jgi:hypothetical protein
MHVKGLGLNTAGTATVLNHTASGIQVQVDPPTNNKFFWESGSFSAPAYGQFSIEVDFEGGSHTGSYTTSMHIVAGGFQFTVPVTANVTASGPPK